MASSTVVYEDVDGERWLSRAVWHPSPKEEEALVKKAIADEATWGEPEFPVGDVRYMEYMMWFVHPDWRLPVEPYQCPGCGYDHAKGWACIPGFKKEVHHANLEGC